nr:hypothetical protein CFP56_49739 [Quercus suber]
MKLSVFKLKTSHKMKLSVSKLTTSSYDLMASTPGQNEKLKTKRQFCVFQGSYKSLPTLPFGDAAQQFQEQHNQEPRLRFSKGSKV